MLHIHIIFLRLKRQNTHTLDLCFCGYFVFYFLRKIFILILFLCNKSKMTTVNPVSSQIPGTSRMPLNKFLFNILNGFSLDEFQQHTNFRQILEDAINKTFISSPDPFSLDDRIRYHFRRSISDEDKWHRGLFNGLKLKKEFYGSDAAQRIFKNVYGLKECVVRLSTECRNSAQFGGRLQDEKNVTVKTDLTTSDEVPVIIDQLKIRIKYPRKQAQVDKSTFKISSTHINHYQTGYASTVKLEPIDEPIVFSTEFAATSSKRVSVPPRLFRDEKTFQQQSDRSSHSSKETEQLPSQLPVTGVTNPPILKTDGSPTKHPQNAAAPERPLVRKSERIRRKQLQLPPKVLSVKSVHNSSYIEPGVQNSTNVVVQMLKAKVGRKSKSSKISDEEKPTVRKSERLIRKQLLLKEQETVEPPVKRHKKSLVATQKSKIGSKTASQNGNSSKSPPVQQHSSNKQRSKKGGKSTEKMETSCHRQQNHENSSLIECNGVRSSEATTQHSDWYQLLHDINRSIDRARQHSAKYVVETDRNIQSIEHFWNDYLGSEFKVQSKPIPNQIDAVEPKSPQNDQMYVENVMNVTELVDPHLA